MDNKNITRNSLESIFNHNLLFNGLVPKFLNKFIGKSKKDFWQKYFDSMNPNKSLGYVCEHSYLEINSLTKQQIILNSIKNVYNDLDIEDYEVLTDYFEQLISTERIKVIKDNNLTIYREIIDVLSYIKQIEKLLKEYPLQSSEHKGTAYTCNQKKLINTQINKLTDRLHHPYFPIKNLEEIENTNYILKLLNYCLDEKYKNFPESLNFVNMSFGLDAELINIEDKKLETIISFLDFFNGIKTAKIELVQSVALFINITFQQSKLDNKKKAEIILNLIKMFFLNEINEYDKKNNKKTFTFNSKSIESNIRIKTIFQNTPIYAYNYSNSNDFMQELVLAGMSSIFGINNIYEPDKPLEENISNFTSLRSIAEFKRETGFTKQELKIIESFIANNNQLH